MLPVNCGSHADYQNFVLTNLCKHYPNPDSLVCSTLTLMTNLMVHYSSFIKLISLISLYLKLFKRVAIIPFIDLNCKGGRPPVYKEDFTIDKDGVPIYQAGCRMRRDGTEIAKGRTTFKCPTISFANGTISCTCDNPCSDA